MEINCLIPVIPAASHGDESNMIQSERMEERRKELPRSKVSCRMHL